MSLAAAASGLRVEYVDGVKGDEMSDKAIPAGQSEVNLNSGALGSWRAHLNAILRVVELNLTSALILEDDVDWDIRLKHQLRDFASAANALTQPLLANSGGYADPTYMGPKASLVQGEDMTLDKLPPTVLPRASPYGDEWDVLWLGHCGMNFPTNPGFPKHPKGRVIHKDDVTVPETHYLRSLIIPADLKEVYPSHTRVVHHAAEGVCTLGYAVTQAAARRLLYSVGIKQLNSAFDIMLREYCDGTSSRRYHRCLSVQPELFNHHRPVTGSRASFSEISNHGDSANEKAYTENIRWSVKVNFDKLVHGEEDYIDQYPDIGKGE